MAILKLEDGNTYTDINAIARYLSELNVHVEQLPLQKYLTNPEMGRLLQNILSHDILSLAQKQEILQVLRPKFVTSKSIDPCSWCELVVANPSSPHLYQLLAQGSRPHSDTNNEVLYILAGECILGFSHPDGFRMELMVQAHDYITVPAGIRHWFSLSSLLQVKAVRYFTSISPKQKSYIFE